MKTLITTMLTLLLGHTSFADIDLAWVEGKYRAEIKLPGFDDKFLTEFELSDGGVYKFNGNGLNCSGYWMIPAGNNSIKADAICGLNVGNEERELAFVHSIDFSNATTQIIESGESFYGLFVISFDNGVDPDPFIQYVPSHISKID